MKEEFGTQLESGALRYVRDLPGPIERVWSYLVEPEKRATWFCGGTMGEKPGDIFTMAFDHDQISHERVPQKFADLDGGIDMEGQIVEIDPPRLLVFKWTEEDHNVRIELDEEGSRVKLTLIQSPHSAFGDLVSAAAGWQVHLGILIDRLAGETPRGFWSEHDVAEDYYREALSPAP